MNAENQSIILKPCENKDIENIYKMSIKNIERFESLTPAEKKKKRSEVDQKIKSNIKSYQRIYDKEEHLGYVYLHQDHSHIEAEDFLLFKEQTKKSFGQLLVDYFKDLSKNYGKPLFLSIFKMDTHAFNLYFSKGFDVYQCVQDQQVKMRYQSNNQ